MCLASYEQKQGESNRQSGAFTLTIACAAGVHVPCDENQTMGSGLHIYEQEGDDHALAVDEKEETWNITGPDFLFKAKYTTLQNKSIELKKSRSPIAAIKPCSKSLMFDC